MVSSTHEHSEALLTMIPEHIRNNLVCPICRGELEDRRRGLYCAKDTRLYPVVKGVPYMTMEDSIKTTAPDTAQR